MVVLPVLEARVVAPVEERVVKAAVEGVVAPIAVPLIPVLVVLKYSELMVKALEPVEIEEALKPERLRVPLVAVRLRAPDERVKPFEAVNNWVEVRLPTLVVVILFAPRVMDAVLRVPILIAPLVCPAPALMMTFPPLPPVVDSAPAVRFNAPPVPPVPVSVPAVKFNAPPFAAAALLVAGRSEREFPPVKVVMSGKRFPARASWPVGLTVTSLVPLF